MENSKIGLVLSGGGTRGLAHAGVLKFLNEKNIEPDILSCCSAGSIVGSLYAVGKTPEEILDFFSLSIFSIGNILRLINLDLFHQLFSQCI